MSKKLLIQEHKKKLLFNEFFQLKELIKAENPSSVIASLNDGYLKKYLNKCILSNFIYVYLCINKKKIIGYAIFAKKPDYLISEHSNLKFRIFISLLFNLKFITILNLILKFFRLDEILISGKSKLVYKNNLNLNMFAVGKKYQSMGIGTSFLKKLFNNLNKKKIFSYVTLEAIDKNAIIFYQKKFSFKISGTKLKFFKNLKILVKKMK